VGYTFWIVVGLFGGWANTIFGQFNFTNYDYRHGLTLTYVKQIEQDSAGYMWFGSRNGLTRFDGIHFEYFTAKDRTEHSPSGDDIREIKTAPDGKVWISTFAHGLKIFDPMTGRFTPVKLRPDSGKLEKGAFVVEMLFDSDTTAWLCGELMGFGQLNTRTLRFHRVSELPSNSNTRDVCTDKKSPDVLYIAEEEHIWRYSKRSHTCEQLEDNESAGHWFGKIVMDDEGILWCGGFLDVLYSINPRTREVRKYPHSYVESSNIIFYRPDEMWIGLASGGIRRFHTKTLKTELIFPEAYDRSSLGSIDVRTLYKDKDGRIWAGTASGVSMLDPYNQLVRPHKVFVPGTERALHISGYYEDARGNVLLCGVYYDTLLFQSAAEQAYRKIPIAKGAGALHQPYEIIDAKGQVLVFYSNGIGVFDEGRRILRRYDAPGISELLHKVRLGSVCRAPGGNVWVTATPDILFLLDPRKGVLDTFHIYPGERPQGDFSRALVCNDAGDVWMERGRKIVHLHPANRTRHLCGEPAGHSYWAPGLQDITITDDSTLWVATWKYDLYSYRYEKGELVPQAEYSAQDGLSPNGLSSLRVTDDQRIFAGSTSGLHIYDLDKKRFETLTKKDGLLNNSVRGMCFSKGDLIAMHENGYSVVPLDKPLFSPKPPRLVLDHLMTADTTYVLYHRKDIAISYRNNDITIRFTALDYGDPNLVRYQYKLGPLQEWQTADYSNNTVHYSNLFPGDYTFTVRARSGNGIWSEPMHLGIYIVPLFWQTWWFVALTVLLVGLGVWMLYLWRIKQIRVRETIKAEYDNRIANLELKALRAQMNPHFMFNSLNSIKNYILKNQPGVAAEYLSNFSHLIRLILQHSKEKMITLEDEMDTLMLYVELEKLRFRDNFSFHCQVDDHIDLKMFMVPPMLLQPYVENAIWHGLLHKEDERILNIKFTSFEGGVLCQIEDNGIGREAALQMKSKTASRYKSMGMGITHDRIQVINSMNNIGIKLEVIDKKDKDNRPLGTLIKIILPYANDTH